MFKIQVYDNEGKTLDRYTVVIFDSKTKIYSFYGMSKTAEGFNQFCGDSRDKGFKRYNPKALNSFLGNKLKTVPQSIQGAINNRIN